uniref:capsular polysaccharide export protein, LipB/KpsS family n=2 Tax=Yoonia sp. TaxID=2212373 RepID=UPI0040478535
MHFICLNPRKAKQATIKKMLSPLGTISWLRIARMSFASSKRAHDVANTALEMSKDNGQTGLGRALNLWLLRRQYMGSLKHFQTHPTAIAVCWNGLNGTRHVFMQAAKDAGTKRLFFELAPLPDRITVDPQGVNFANSLPRTIAPYHAWAAAHGPVDWRHIASAITQRAATNTPPSTPDCPPLSGNFIFVPLQTPGDSQLRLFGGAFQTVDAFVETLIDASNSLPDGWHIRLKDHPTSTSTAGDLLLNKGDAPIYLDNGTNTFDQVKASRAVMTVNSSVGLEAMFFGKPVIACGQCFWAIDGVAQSTITPQAIKAALQNPASLVYDPLARQSFLGFITNIYYPKLENAAALIIDRTSGKDRFGFWGDSS